jgi:DNA-binding GntR family transcriptional regulator
MDRLTDQLKEMIMTGELGPDAPVNINAIAKQATVSLVPVREALARLSASGLLQFKPNRGYRVSPRLTPEGREALFEARELLELSAAPLAGREPQPRTDGRTSLAQSGDAQALRKTSDDAPELFSIE